MNTNKTLSQKRIATLRDSCDNFKGNTYKNYIQSQLRVRVAIQRFSE